MSEKPENKSSNGENTEKIYNNRKLPYTIISLGLIVAAVMIVFTLVSNRLSAGSTETGSIWSTGGRLCSSSGNITRSTDQLAMAGLDYYRANYGDSEGLEAKTDDFGCHQEITIYSNGEAVRKFSHSNGNFYDLTP